MNWISVEYGDPPQGKFVLWKDDDRHDAYRYVVAKLIIENDWSVLVGAPDWDIHIPYIESNYEYWMEIPE